MLLEEALEVARMYGVPPAVFCASATGNVPRSL
ncbi:hypothetical protein PF002_g22746 [Phytophthora fragariae]|uniref:Uncharacterized protein n=1 Tax=Phytophthora fragariae TaxID=53985 RepID=A0A6A3XE44_9STRA|nr:hypothetical protein PF003_g23029 [Phytophthora fragariae]KAE9197439.1 hypothetical protein PF002_g22746 [Phytophthora fragariae]